MTFIRRRTIAPVSPPHIPTTLASATRGALTTPEVRFELVRARTPEFQYAVSCRVPLLANRTRTLPSAGCWRGTLSSVTEFGAGVDAPFDFPYGTNQRTGTLWHTITVRQPILASRAFTLTNTGYLRRTTSGDTQFWTAINATFRLSGGTIQRTGILWHTSSIRKSLLASWTDTLTDTGYLSGTTTRVTQLWTAIDATFHLSRGTIQRAGICSYTGSICQSLLAVRTSALPDTWCSCRTIAWVTQLGAGGNAPFNFSCGTNQWTGILWHTNPIVTPLLASRADTYAYAFWRCNAIASVTELRTRIDALLCLSSGTSWCRWALGDTFAIIGPLLSSGASALPLARVWRFALWLITQLGAGIDASWELAQGAVLDAFALLHTLAVYTNKAVLAEAVPGTGPILRTQEMGSTFLPALVAAAQVLLVLPTVGFTRRELDTVSGRVAGIAWLAEAAGHTLSGAVARVTVRLTIGGLGFGQVNFVFGAIWCWERGEKGKLFSSTKFSLKMSMTRKQLTWTMPFGNANSQRRPDFSTFAETARYTSTTRARCVYGATGFLAGWTAI